MRRALRRLFTRRRMCWAVLGAGLTVPASARAQLTIHVGAVPAAKAHDATVYVAGSFNGWNPGAPAYALRRDAASGYVITLPESVRGAIEFKFTLGSWGSVETAAAGGEVPNRTFVIPAAGAATYVATIAAWHADAGANGVPTRAASTASSSVSILSDHFFMPQLGRARRIRLYLPPGYAGSRRRYPVLYMQDGQNVFDAATSFAGEWGIDETLDSLHAAGDPGLIVVAADNDGAHRLDEYDPWVNPTAKYGGGEGDAYVKFLTETLKPYVDRHYRTRPGRMTTAIGGSSMGGLIALYAALARPDVFGKAAVFSCACWIAEGPLLALARQARPKRPWPRLYFVSGARETETGEPAREQAHVADALIAAGFPRGRSVRALTRTDGKHAEWFWRREFVAAYRWLFADTSSAAAAAPGRSNHR
ncbi:MAG: alpha/beta hydrolase-fold protein [bacterium]